MSEEKTVSSSVNAGSASPTSVTQADRKGGIAKARTPKSVMLKGAYSDFDAGTFEGATPEIGMVLGLKGETLKNKGSFDLFREKVGDYVRKKLTDGHLVATYVTKMKDPTAQFVVDEMPVISDDDRKAGGSKLEVYQARLKIYLTMEYRLKANKVTVYTLVWGQLSAGLKAVIRGDERFEEMHDRKNILWLLERLKLITSGVDENANIYESAYKVLLDFLTIRQHESETNETYLEQFKDWHETLRVLCGDEFLVSEKLIGKADYS
jgi:hypothetical protein